MDEKTGGMTAMERLARELMDVLFCKSLIPCTTWCMQHGIDTLGTSYKEDIENARADIERRIAEARYADSLSALGDGLLLCERSNALDAVCEALGVDDHVDATVAARALLEEHYELKELREACRIMPEGMRWPRYEDGEPVRMGDPFVAWDGQASEVRSVTLYAPGPDAAWAINAGSCRNFVGGSDEAHRMHGLRLKRPAPKAVGADGVEVKPGETVWLAEEYRDKALSTGPSHNLHYVAPSEKMSVSEVRKGGCGEVAWMDGRGTRWCPASWLTHERPDS